MKRTIKKDKTAGFTLVELLTVIGVIAILLAFLIPALTSVEKTALKVKQRAQFHGIEVALEAFHSDMGDYPPSAYSSIYNDGTTVYTASQRLAEALVGRDGFGFHSDSRFNATGTDKYGNPLYYPGIATLTQPEIDANMAKRKGPYLELETANAVRLSNLYGTGAQNLPTALSATADTSYVLADMYKITKNLKTGKLTGSPILYYKANRNKIQHDLADANINPAVNQCTYNVYDSIGAGTSTDSIVDLRPLSFPQGSTARHPMSPFSLSGGGAALFYQQTLNPNFTNPPRPYRADSFILQSAGPDSLYGTADDVFNFDQEN